MLKSKVEAILFLTDKPMRAQAIARIVNEDVQVVRQAILDLIHDYEERASGLEIADDNGYIIQVKDEYASIIDEFVPMEMPVSLIRTLSAIAIKQPVMQSEIIKIRGAGAYDHIKELMVRELIIKKEEGRSPTLSTTKKFQEYFRLSHDAKSLRTELRKEDKVAAKELEGAGSDVPNIEPGSVESDQAMQLEVLFETSPDSSLVFRPTDLDGTVAPLGVDLDNDITVMVDDIGAGDSGGGDGGAHDGSARDGGARDGSARDSGAGDNGSQGEGDVPSINVSVSPDMTSTDVESAATVTSKIDSTSSGSSAATDKNPESDNNDE